MATAPARHTPLPPHQAALEAAEALLGPAPLTSTTQSTLEASLDAIMALLDKGSRARASFALGSEDKVTFVATAGRGAEELRGTTLDLEALTEPMRDLLLRGKPIEVDAAAAGISGAKGSRLSLRRARRVLFLNPLFMHGGPTAILSVETSATIPADVRKRLGTLGALVAPVLQGMGVEEDQHLQRNRERFRSLVQNSSDVVMLVDIDTTIQYVTPSAERVLGYNPAALIGTKLTNLLHRDDVPAVLAFFSEATKHSGVTPTVEWRARHRSGPWLHLETIGNNLLDDPNVGHMVLNTRDISDRKTLEQQLSHQAFHDPLTNLANRALFKDRVEHALLSRARATTPLGVLFLDLDNFKTVNDSLGHVVGDELLIAAAKRIQSCLRSADTAARLGGDEFAVLIEDAAGEVSIQIAERIIEAFKAPFTLQGKKSFIHTSVGIATSSSHEGADEILRNADIAMYTAKNAGKACHAVFEQEMHAVALEQLELDSDLRRAVEREEFVLHYQPITDLTTGRIVGVEALVRWQHPERGLLPPSHFISRAEETGIILPMGQWVLREACRQVAAWNRDNQEGPPLLASVNLSGKQLESPTLVEDIGAVLTETGIHPSALILELTESMMMHNTDATIELLKKLKGLGVELAVDDFGTGYSSLHYLPSFPIDILKIAKQFVDGIQGGTQESALLYTIIDLCRTLGLRTLAEGIEYASQAEWLRKLRCEWGQGYYLSKPLDVEQMTALLASRKLTEYAAEVQNTVERREAEWWGRVVGNYSAS